MFFCFTYLFKLIIYETLHLGSINYAENGGPLGMGRVTSFISRGC